MIKKVKVSGKKGQKSGILTYVLLKLSTTSVKLMKLRVNGQCQQFCLIVAELLLELAS